MDKRISLIVMVTGMIIAYIYYVRIMKRKEAERKAAGAVEEVCEKPPTIAVKEAAAPAPTTKLPTALLIFATMMGLYAAYILYQSMKLALAGLQDPQIGIGGVVWMVIPATLRLVILLLLFKRNKAFRWGYVLLVALAFFNVAYTVYAGVSAWNAGHLLLALFYGGWLTYLFRSKYIQQSFTYGKLGKTKTT